MPLRPILQGYTQRLFKETAILCLKPEDLTI